MKELIQSKYRNFFLAALLLNLLCAWFSKGFFQADEHFQVLEFCNYRLGNLSAGDMPWEFQLRVRATLLPDIAYGLAKIMDWWGLYNPFILAFLLRLLSGLASWFIACKLIMLLSGKMKTPIGERLFVLMSLFLWFIPYLNVRFTSENMTGVLFLYALYPILKNVDNMENLGKAFIWAGLLIGVSFFIRFQIVFAVAGLAAWLLIIKKTKIKFFFILAISACISIGLNVLLDKWYYGDWVFTPFNYFYENVIHHKAASFGVNPWWFYVPEFIVKSFPPLSVLLLGMFIVGVWKNLKDPLVWVIILFVILHSFTVHKEIRFMFPMAFIFVYVTSLGFDYALTKEFYRKIHKYVYTVALIICIPLLLYRTFVPSNISVNYFQFLYNHISAKKSVLIFMRKDYDFALYGLKSSFYKNPASKTVSIDSIAQIGDVLQVGNIKSALFLSKENNNLDLKVVGYKQEVAYCIFPDWVLKCDINNWVERTQVWKIYRLTKN